jgi:nickel-dependent lactate racemase
MRADLEEAAAMVGLDLLLNVVVDAEHRIVAAVAGDAIAAHRAACDWVARRGKVAVPEPGDIVLVSPGGFPKDINLYQAHKAVEHAIPATRSGGTIILVAECAEGLGNAVFEQWITSGQTCDQLLEHIKRKFVLGGHKAAAIAKLARQAELLLVSPALGHLSLSCLQHQPTVAAALNAACKRLGSEASVIVLPHGISVLPNPSAVTFAEPG